MMRHLKYRKYMGLRSRSRGGMLVELLVTLIINLILLGGLVKVYGHLLVSSTIQRERIELTRSVQDLLIIIQKEFQQTDVSISIKSSGPLIVTQSKKNCLIFMNATHRMVFLYSFGSRKLKVERLTRDVARYSTPCYGGEVVFDPELIEVKYFEIDDQYRPLVKIKITACYVKNSSLCVSEEIFIVLDR